MCERNIRQLSLTCPQLGTWPAAQACALTGSRSSKLSVHRPVLNPLSHTSQGWEDFSLLFFSCFVYYYFVLLLGTISGFIDFLFVCFVFLNCTHLYYFLSSDCFGFSLCLFFQFLKVEAQVNWFETCLLFKHRHLKEQIFLSTALPAFHKFHILISFNSRYFKNYLVIFFFWHTGFLCVLLTFLIF